MHTHDHDDDARPARRGTLEFDAVTARLRADSATFFALVDHVVGSGPRPRIDPGRGAFPASAAIFEGLAHPLVRTRLGVVDAPCARLEVEVATPTGTRLHEGWLDRMSTLLLDRGDGTHDVIEVEADFLAPTLIRLTDLQPGPRLEGRGGRVDPDVLDALLSWDTDTRTDAARELARATGPWPAVEASVHAGWWQVCGLDLAHAVGPRTSTRRLTWLDTPAGVLRLDAEPDGTGGTGGTDAGPRLVGSSAGALWRAVVESLPPQLGHGLLTRTC